MELLGWLAWGAQLFSLGVAGGSLWLSFRSRSAEAASRGAWLCLGAVLVLVVLGVAGYLHGMSIAFGAIAGAEAAQKARLLAQGLSEAMNCAAFLAFATLPVGLGALILFVRSRVLSRAHSRGGGVSEPLQ